MKNFSFLTLFCLLTSCALLGCATTQSAGRARGPQAPGESQAQVVSAMSQVVSAVSGKPVNQKDLQNLGQQIENDPQAKSAMQSVTQSVSGQGPAIKYCPVDGQRYGPKFTECPDHHVPLKILNE